MPDDSTPDLMGRWAALTDRERHAVVEGLAVAEPARLSDAVSVIEAGPCLECEHTRHPDGSCLSAYLDRDGLDRVCWCTSGPALAVALGFNSHADDALALLADDLRADERVEYAADEARDAAAERRAL